MPCDICSRPTTDLNNIPNLTMRQAILSGFTPFTAGLLPQKLSRLATPDSPAKWKQQAMDGLLAETDWKLCNTCTAKIQKTEFRNQNSDPSEF